MTAQAPICHIPPQQLKVQPLPVNLPSIPPATPDLQSLTATVNTMRQVINYITGRQGPQGRQGAQGKPGEPPKPARWTENARVTETVRVFQNNDPSSSNWVDVERINGLTMRDGVTGESWDWNRK